MTVGISGKDVNLKAGGNVNISSAEQINTNTTNQSSKGGSLGVAFGGGLPVVNGTIYSGNEKEQGTVMTHRGSTVTADQTLTVENGKDTNILGSKAEGKKVVANIGGNGYVKYFV